MCHAAWELGLARCNQQRFWNRRLRRTCHGGSGPQILLRLSALPGRSGSCLSPCPTPLQARPQRLSGPSSRSWLWRHLSATPHVLHESTTLSYSAVSRNPVNVLTALGLWQPLVNLLTHVPKVCALRLEAEPFTYLRGYVSGLLLLIAWSLSQRPSKCLQAHLLRHGCLPMNVGAAHP